MSRFFSQKAKDMTQTNMTTQKKTNPAFSSNDFPDLIGQTSTHASKSMNTMNYKNKLEIVDSIVEPTVKHGHVSLSYDKITGKLIIEHGPKQPPKSTKSQKQQQQPSFEKLVKHWEKWYDDYIELYGQEIYDHIHLYPFYNYNYFNELDEIFYRELEELEKMEEAEYEEYED